MYKQQTNLVMCLFNVPFVFMVMFWWGNLGNEDSYEGMTRLQMVALPIMIAPIIIGIVLDVISFPFHLLNLI